jgi:hypothetical protein
VVRLQQLCDLLVLWGHTTNFLYPQVYEPVECDPIKVYARDLGNNIPKSVRDANRTPTKKGGSTRKASKTDSPSSTALIYQQNQLDKPSPSSRACDEESEICISSDHNKSMSLSNEQLQSISLTSASDSNNFDPCESHSLNEAESRNSVEPVALSVEEKAKDRSGGSNYLDPDDIVYTGSETFDPMFIFWQLMGWYDAGSDNPIQAPEVFGTLQLPLPAQCFGMADVAYGDKERAMLIDHVTDVFKQSTPWSAQIVHTFTAMSCETTENHKRLIGSPFLDILLGAGGVTKSLQKEFPTSTAVNKPPESLQKLQFDDLLPPETTHCTWVQCSKCSKWRRVAWFIDPSSLPQDWKCNENSWDTLMASCKVPSDYDPELEDSGATEPSQIDDVWTYLEHQPKTTIEDCPVGSMKDVFCLINKVWYKARITAHRPVNANNGPDPMVRVHFLGWQSKFDENISIYSGRIQPLGTYSDHGAAAMPLKSEPNEPKGSSKCGNTAKQNATKLRSELLRSNGQESRKPSGAPPRTRQNKTNSSKTARLSESIEKKRSFRPVAEWVPTIPQKKTRSESSRSLRGYDEMAILEAVLLASKRDMKEEDAGANPVPIDAGETRVPTSNDEQEIAWDERSSDTLK